MVSFTLSMYYCVIDLLLDRYDLLHNAHLKLEGLDELFKVAQVAGKICSAFIYLLKKLFSFLLNKLYTKCPLLYCSGTSSTALPII